MNLKAIETRYRGLIFRSKLEAQWAVFFDKCGAVWKYEPEKFDLKNGIGYLPDFLIKDALLPGGKRQDLYVEVKGKMRQSDIKKIKRFVYKDLRTIRKNAHQAVDTWLTGIDIDEAENIPKLNLPVERPLAIVGVMPTPPDFEYIFKWLEYKYGDKHDGNEAIYNYNYINPSLEPLKGERFFLPVPAKGGGVAFFPQSKLEGATLSKTSQIFYEASHYHFEYQKQQEWIYKD